MAREQATVIDANGLVLGRMASTVAKRLLQGENITIINAEKAVISGKRLSRVKEAKRKLEIGHPRKGPFHSRRPEQIVRRTIRGMLPRKKPKGQQAYRRLRVFVDVPEEVERVILKALRRIRTIVTRLPGEWPKICGVRSALPRMTRCTVHL